MLTLGTLLRETESCTAAAQRGRVTVKWPGEGSISEVERKAGNAPGKGWNGILEAKRAEGGGVTIWQAVKPRGLLGVSWYAHLHTPHPLAELCWWKERLLSFWMPIGNVHLLSVRLKGEPPQIAGSEMVKSFEWGAYYMWLWPNNAVSFACEGSTTPVLSVGLLLLCLALSPCHQLGQWTSWSTVTPRSLPRNWPLATASLTRALSGVLRRLISLRQESESLTIIQCLFP